MLGRFPAARRLFSLTAYPLTNSLLSNTDALSLMLALLMTVPALLVNWMQPLDVLALLRRPMYGNISASAGVGVAAGAPTPNSARAQPVQTMVRICDAALSASSATVIAEPAMTPAVRADAPNLALVRVDAATAAACRLLAANLDAVSRDAPSVSPTMAPVENLVLPSSDAARVSATIAPVPNLVDVRADAPMLSATNVPVASFVLLSTDAARVSATIVPVASLVLLRVDAATAAAWMALAANCDAPMLDAARLPTSTPPLASTSKLRPVVVGQARSLSWRLAAVYITPMAGRALALSAVAFQAITSPFISAALKPIL